MLVPGEDLVVEAAEFAFLPGNILRLELTFKNVSSCTFSELNFSRGAGSRALVDSVEPEISSADLGGDGMLVPGEVTDPLQFPDWSVGEATLNAVFYDASGNKVEVATGEVGADGKLEVFLKKNVADNLLTELSACWGLTQSDPSVRQNTFSALEVMKETTVVGRAALASGQAVLTEGLQIVGEYYVQQTYADTATMLQGSCSLLGAVDAVFKYNLKLNRGWNAVTFKLVGKNGDAQTLELSSGMPQGATWFFAP